MTGCEFDALEVAWSVLVIGGAIAVAISAVVAGTVLAGMKAIKYMDG